MNLVKVDGTYAKELFDNMNEIRKTSFNDRVSTEEMKEYILSVIEPAKFNAVAKKRFIGYLNNCSTKKEIYWLCSNTVQKAMKYKPSSKVRT